jgi:DNA-directed RNA polymerase subunit alpha
MAQDQATTSQAVEIVLAPTLDIEEFLELPHLSSQSVSERQELQSLLDRFDSAGEGLDEKALRKAAAKWALGQDPSAELSGIKHPLALMIQSRIKQSQGDYQNALSLAAKAAKESQTEVMCVTGEVECMRRCGKIDEALERTESLRREFSDRGEFHYVEGRCREDLGQYEEAIASYKEAIEKNKDHYRAIFRHACLADLRGDEDTALELYGKIGPGRRHAFIGAALNMALIYEDRGEYDKGISCCRSVLRMDPNNHRARLYMGDIEESMQMYYSPEEAKESERLEAILRVPVSDFELSVRSRNCLARMNIRSLGDLVRKTEQEMLSYKNFGETSLREIKEMLHSKGLRLGMLREDGMPRPVLERRQPAEVPTVSTAESAPIDDLEFSVRSRKCMERLNAQTIGDLTCMSEPELMQIKNFGRVSLQEIKDKLSERGLSLRQD